MNEWISVKDRLPEKETDVLVWQNMGTYKSTKVVQLIFNEDPYPEGFWEDGNGHFFHLKYGTHWRPVPEPPKEEK